MGTYQTPQMKNWRNIIIQKRTVSDDFIRTMVTGCYLILGTRPRIDQSVNALISKEDAGPFHKSDNNKFGNLPGFERTQ